MPRRPTNRIAHRAAEPRVETTRMSNARLAMGDRQPRWDSATYQPRASITTVTTSSGHVSTRNAGATASPAELPPSRPSRPGTTHHHGRGISPLSAATNGFSIGGIFNMTANLDFPSSPYEFGPPGLLAEAASLPSHSPCLCTVTRSRMMVPPLCRDSTDAPQGPPGRAIPPGGRRSWSPARPRRRAWTCERRRPRSPHPV